MSRACLDLMGVEDALCSKVAQVGEAQQAKADQP